MAPESEGKKKSTLRILGILAAIVGVAGACVVVATWWGHVSINPIAPPKDSNANFEMPPTTSNLSLSVILPVESIRAILEEEVKNPIKVDGKDDWHVVGDLNRQPIAVHCDVQAKKVHLATSVAGKVQAEKNFPVTGRFSVGVNVKGNLGASLSPVFATDWSIAPNMVLTTYLEKATTKVPLIGDVEITGIIKGIVDKSLDGATKAAQDKVAKAINVKADIEKIWNQITSVHRLSKSPPVWLRITPKKATFAQFAYKADSLGTGLALELESHVYIQDKAPELMKTPLPQLVLTARLPGEFNLSIPVEVSYAAINSLLKDELTTHPLSLKVDATVTITDASVQPYGDGVLLTVEFKGQKGYFTSASGRLYISGIPVYDKDKAELRINQMNYTAETKDIVLKSVEWLDHFTLLDKVKAAAVMKLDSEVKKAKGKANEQLADLKKRLPQEIIADFSIADLFIERIVFAKERAFAIVKAQGTLSAQLSSQPRR